MSVARGRQFLHTPGPTNMPERVLRAMDRAAMDHRGPEFTAPGRLPWSTPVRLATAC